MKKLIGIIILGTILSSCTLFQKPAMTQDEIDAMVAENETLKAQVEESKDLADQLALARKQADDAMIKLAECEENANSKVHIIVGAFKKSSNADAYSADIKAKGYDGKIIPGPYNFSLVTSGSYGSVKASLNELGSVRNNLIETAWIYIE
jgi:cell division protein FtsN